MLRELHADEQVMVKLQEIEPRDRGLGGRRPDISVLGNRLYAFCGRVERLIGRLQLVGQAAAGVSARRLPQATRQSELDALYALGYRGNVERRRAYKRTADVAFA
jgi:hypothetical protein